VHQHHQRVGRVVHVPGRGHPQRAPLAPVEAGQPGVLHEPLDLGPAAGRVNECARQDPAQLSSAYRTNACTGRGSEHQLDILSGDAARPILVGDVGGRPPRRSGLSTSGTGALVSVSIPRPSPSVASARRLRRRRPLPAIRSPTARCMTAARRSPRNAWRRRRATAGPMPAPTAPASPERWAVAAG